MSLAVWFWILMVIWLIFGAWAGYNPQQPWFRNWGGTGLLFVLLVILGWATFGTPVK